jgi:hypothetical protein
LGDSTIEKHRSFTSILCDFSAWALARQVFLDEALPESGERQKAKARAKIQNNKKKMRSGERGEEEGEEEGELSEQSPNFYTRYTVDPSHIQVTCFSNLIQPPHEAHRSDRFL